MVALFRIAPVASGSILIDGIDISTIPLTILRSKLGIIPQVCALFLYVFIHTIVYNALHY